MMKQKQTNPVVCILLAMITGLIALVGEILFWVYFRHGPVTLNRDPSILVFGVISSFSIPCFLFSFILISYPSRLFLVGDSSKAIICIKVITSVFFFYCCCCYCGHGIFQSKKETAMWSLVYIFPSLLTLTVPRPWRS